MKNDQIWYDIKSIKSNLDCFWLYPGLYLNDVLKKLHEDIFVKAVKSFAKYNFRLVILLELFKSSNLFKHQKKRKNASLIDLSGC